MWSLPNSTNQFVNFEEHNVDESQSHIFEMFTARRKEIGRAYSKYQKTRRLIEEAIRQESTMETLVERGFQTVDLAQTAQHINDLVVQKESIVDRQKLIESLDSKIKMKHVTFNLTDKSFSATAEIVLAELEKKMGLCSQFYKCGLSIAVKNINTQINNSTVTKSQHGELGDDFLPKNKTKYLHIDGKPTASLKLLIYLNNVSLENGPFRFVVEQKYHPSEEEIIIRKTNDSLGFGEKQLASLPKPYRARCVFGNDIDEDHPEYGFLLSNEKVITGQAGTGILFDNNKVHRGGFVREGVRHMAQVNFAISLRN